MGEGGEKKILETLREKEEAKRDENLTNCNNTVAGGALQRVVVKSDLLLYYIGLLAPRAWVSGVELELEQLGSEGDSVFIFNPIFPSAFVVVMVSCR